MSAEFDQETARLQQDIGYTFRDVSLLETALTHKSYVNETPGAVEDNQRLEFLGDAVLGLVVAEHLMRRLTKEPEGTLTKWRAALVNEGSLAELGRDIALGDALRLGHGERLNNGSDRASTLSDAVEALLGAVYLDGGFDAATAVIVGLLSDKLSDVEEGREPMDAKGALQEILQAQGVASPHYRLVNQEGPDHAKVFEVAILVNNEVIGSGRGRSKKEAEKTAAKMALKEVSK